MEIKQSQLVAVGLYIVITILVQDNVSKVGRREEFNL